MANKKTQREFYNDIIEVVKAAGRDDLVEFCEGRIEVLDKKSANRKPTKAQRENEDLKVEVETVLKGADDALTVSEVMAGSEVLAGLSNQKVAALLKGLVADGKAVKSAEGKKSVWTLA